ncbi:kinesin-like protein subito [Melanaphis sacchari]|uniref:kinesin-like protein subito n=1 Tax=Melanaphis sacchari TaxID=742174 RepID=UPI000DC14F7D|nr:kinesin-like protein subito [Melanaphis sacchari]
MKTDTGRILSEVPRRIIRKIKVDGDQFVWRYISTTKNQEKKKLHHDFSLEYIEIYNDDVYDLSIDANNLPLKKTKHAKLNEKLKFSISSKGDIKFKNLTKIKITNCNDAIKILEVGNMRKSVSSTSMNAESSRSHCICMISYKSKHKEMKLNLVDLAGSERISKSVANKKTLAESRSINIMGG